MARILIVEDDEDIAELERDYLEANSLEAEIAGTGPQGLKLALEGGFDAMILDVMLPGMNGFDVCRKVRESSALPILLVTARTEDIDQIRGLGLGADGYVVKPFSPSVLVARVKALLATAERSRQDAGGTTSNASRHLLSAGNVTVDEESHEVRVKGKLVELANREYELLVFLLKHRGTVFSREALYERVWGEEALGDGATVTVHIQRLREKLEEDPSHPTLIQTVRGAGYIVRR
ncbi:MAG: response regulator transcription factor [Atopobiaceae bacterium]